MILCVFAAMPADNCARYLLYRRVGMICCIGGPLLAERVCTGRSFVNPPEAFAELITERTIVTVHEGPSRPSAVARVWADKAHPWCGGPFAFDYEIDSVQATRRALPEKDCRDIDF